jgi:hypothetical protein
VVGIFTLSFAINLPPNLGFYTGEQAIGVFSFINEVTPIFATSNILMITGTGDYGIFSYPLLK